MTVASAVNKVVHTGNGSATTFDYDFHIPEGTAKVYLVTIETGASVLLEEEEYEITGLGDPNGGSVEFLYEEAPLSDEYKLVIAREVGYLQETSISNLGGFYPRVMEAQLDNIVYQIQQLAEQLARSVKMGEDVFTAPILIRTGAEGTILGFNAEGQIAPISTVGMIESAEEAANTAITQAALATTARQGAESAEVNAAAQTALAFGYASAAEGFKNEAEEAADDAAGAAISVVNSAIGVSVQGYDLDLAALAGLSSTGLAVRTGSGTWTQRQVTSSGSGVTVTNGTGVSGNPTISLTGGLADIAGAAKSDGNFIVGDGTTWVVENGATARTSLGLGSAALKATGVSGDAVPVLNGGTTTWTNGSTWGGVVQTLSGAMWIDAPSGNNAGVQLRDEAGTNKGVLYWDRGSDTIILQNQVHNSALLLGNDLLSLYDGSNYLPYKPLNADGGYTLSSTAAPSVLLNGAFGSGWAVNNRVHSSLSATHVGASYASLGVIRQVTGSGFALGDPGSSPANADYAAFFEATKDSYLTSTVHGEINGLYVIARQGRRGDASGILIDAEKCFTATTDGGILAIEGSVKKVNSSGTITDRVQVQMGHAEGAGGAASGSIIGFVAEAHTGTLFSAFHADTISPGIWSNILTASASRSATPFFQITGIGLIHANLGSTGVPSLSFVGDTNTGLRGDGSDRIYFVTAGVDKWYVGGGGSIIPLTTEAYDIGASVARVKSIYSLNDLDFSSDIRGKNAETLTDTKHGLAFVRRARPRDFQRLGEERWHHGFVTQELLAAADGEPFYGVRIDADGYQSLNPTALIGPLYNAVDEVASRLETLERRLAA